MELFWHLTMCKQKQYSSWTELFDTELFIYLSLSLSLYIYIYIYIYIYTSGFGFKYPTICYKNKPNQPNSVLLC